MAYDFGKISVLVIEDNQPLQTLLKGLLSVYGFKNIFMAQDGEEGFQILCIEKPDLVITDWMMKPVDGISLTRKIRTDHKSPDPFVPIILMTGLCKPLNVMRARDMGVTEFLVKPFTARDLYRRIVQTIENPRSFVRAEGFIGPDRRRKKDPDYQGTRKRTDEERMSRMDSDFFFVDIENDEF